MEGIRVMETADDRLQFIVGTDICAPSGPVVRERGTTIINGRKVLQMEIGTSGMVVDIPMISLPGGSSGGMVNALKESIEGECFALMGTVGNELSDLLIDQTQMGPLMLFAKE